MNWCVNSPYLKSILGYLFINQVYHLGEKETSDPLVEGSLKGDTADVVMYHNEGDMIICGDVTTPPPPFSSLDPTCPDTPGKGGS